MSEQQVAGSDDVRNAAQAVKDAIDAHLAAVEHRSGENDPAVQSAYDVLAAAAEAYDDVLFSTYEEVTPFGPVEGNVDDDEDDDDMEWDEDDDEDEDEDDDGLEDDLDDDVDGESGE